MWDNAHILTTAKRLTEKVIRELFENGVIQPHIISFSSQLFLPRKKTKVGGYVMAVELN